MLKVYESTRAFSDIIEIANYIAEHGSVDASDRVVSAIRSTYEYIAASPGVGRSVDLGQDIVSLRVVPVSRFRNYLIFFEPTETHVNIRRVLHGARNLNVIFTEQFDD